MTDAPDRPAPRFPESRVADVRLCMRAVLGAQSGLLHGVCSAARGGDLIFLETMLGLGATVTVLLPFPPDAFKCTSVGSGWCEAFDKLTAHPDVDLRPPMTTVVPDSDAEKCRAYEDCNHWILDEFEALAARFADPDPFFLSVFHQTSAQLTGGTWHAIEHCRSRGYAVTIIDPMNCEQ